MYSLSFIIHFMWPCSIKFFIKKILITASNLSPEMNQGSFLDQISVTELLKLASKIKMLAYVIFKLSKVLSEDFS